MPEVILAKTAGFCFGVSKAVKAAYEAAEEAAKEAGSEARTGRPEAEKAAAGTAPDAGKARVYTYGPVIHNEEVVADLERKGVRVLHSEEELRALKDSTVILRSHGVGPEIYRICRENRLRVIDTTCPFVRKIHRIVEQENAKGRRVIIVGDPAHPEVRAIRAYGDDRTAVIEDTDDFLQLNIGKNEEISIVSQTTYNREKFEENVDKLKELGYDIDCFNTICNATQERQAEAGEIASSVDMMIVIGGRNSSNSRKLAEICGKVCKNTVFIQTVKDLEPDALNSVKSVGITAGASTPKHIIEEVQTNVRSQF